MLEGTKIYLLNFTFLQAGTWYGSLVIRDISETYRIRSRVMITRTTKAGHPFIFYYLIFPVSKLLWNMPLTGLTRVAIWGLIVNQAMIFIFFWLLSMIHEWFILYEKKGGVYNLAPRKPSFPQILVSLSARSWQQLHDIGEIYYRSSLLIIFNSVQKFNKIMNCYSLSHPKKT